LRAARNKTAMKAIAGLQKEEGMENKRKGRGSLRVTQGASGGKGANLPITLQ